MDDLGIETSVEEEPVRVIQTAGENELEVASEDATSGPHLRRRS